MEYNLHTAKCTNLRGTQASPWNTSVTPGVPLNQLCTCGVPHRTSPVPPFPQLTNGDNNNSQHLLSGCYPPGTWLSKGFTHHSHSSRLHSSPILILKARKRRHQEAEEHGKATWLVAAGGCCTMLHLELCLHMVGAQSVSATIVLLTAPVAPALSHPAG